MLDVNRGDVVEVLDVSFSPPDRHLRSSENIVVLPSAEYQGMVATFLCSSFCVNGFRMIFFAIDCVRAFSLVLESLHDGMELSGLQI